MIQKAVMQKFTLNWNFKIESLAVVGNSTWDSYILFRIDPFQVARQCNHLTELECFSCSWNYYYKLDARDLTLYTSTVSIINFVWMCLLMSKVEKDQIKYTISRVRLNSTIIQFIRHWTFVAKVTVRNGKECSRISVAAKAGHSLYMTIYDAYNFGSSKFVI